MTVSYTKDLSQRFRNICNKHGVQVYFKESNTIKNFLVMPKEKHTIIQKSEVTYKCDREECDDEYIGKPARTFRALFK